MLKTRTPDLTMKKDVTNRKKNQNMQNRTHNSNPCRIGLILLLLAVSLHFAKAGDKINQLHQKTTGNLAESLQIPGQEGLAGMFAGTHNNVLILAGGTSFPEGKPWEGGVKQFSDAVLIYERTTGGSLKLIHTAQSVIRKTGEGATVSVPQGVICLGGQTPEGLSGRVTQLSWNQGILAATELPELPVPVKSAAASAIGSKIYVVGGEGPDGPMAQFLELDLASPANGWQELAPFPVPVTGAMMAAQMDGEEISLHVIGGRARLPGDNTTRFYPHVFRYRLSARRWEQKRDISINKGLPFPVAAGAAAPAGASHIVLIGGDNGLVFNQVELAIQRMQTGEPEARLLRDSLWTNHPGFNKKILIYNTVTDTWCDEGDWEGPPVAVMPAVIWNGILIIPGGEIKPGIRTPDIREINFSVRPVFGWLNYVVLIVYFAGMLLLGFFFMKKESDTEDFFKAGGRIPWWAA